MEIIWEDILKIVLKAGLAVLIGYVRAKRNKTAVVRINMIVGIISCLIMILSIRVARIDNYF